MKMRVGSWSMPLALVSHTRWEWVAAALAVVAAGTAPAINVSVSPTDLAWNTNTWVCLTVTGVTAGAAVDLRLYADVNRSRTLDANDVWVTELRVQDGVTNAWGSSVIACDTNGVADGRIYVRVSYNGNSEECQLWHAVGEYLWEARLTNGTAAVAALSITQPTSTVWLTGQACVLTNLSPAAGMPKPGALITLEYFSLLDGGAPATWTDTNGMFRLYLPSGISTGNVRNVSAIAAGHFLPQWGPGGPSGGEPLSSLSFGQPLHAGQNALARPLFVVPEVPGELYTVAGRVTDELGQPVCAALVQTSLEDSDAFAVAITDTNGDYSFPYNPVDKPLTVYAADAMINARGLLGSATQLVGFVASRTHVDLRLARATSLVRGAVRNAGGPGGPAGVRVSVGNDVQGSFAYTFDSGGVFEMGAVASTDWVASVDTDSLRPVRRVLPMARTPPLTLPAAGVYTNGLLQFSVEPAWRLWGHIYDSQTNGMTGGGVSAKDPDTWDTCDQSDADLAGVYSLLLTNQPYALHTWGFSGDGYMDGDFTSLVTMAGADVGPIDIFPQQAATIQGRVTDIGGPVSNLFVEANVVTFPDHNSWSSYRAAYTWTDPDGYYTLMVPPGTNYYVRANPAQGSLWIEQWYDGADDVYGAMPVTTSVSQPATNIDFVLKRGTTISGTVRANGAGVSNIWVDVTVTWTNASGEWQWGDYAGGAQSRTDGTYRVTVLPDQNYIVHVYPPDGSPWIEQYYDHRPWFSEATPVHPMSDSPVSGVDFDLVAGALISGTVRGNGQGITNAGVTAYALTLDGTGAVQSYVWAGWAPTSEDGSYLLRVATGGVYAVWARCASDSPFYSQYYSNAMDIAMAARLSPGVDTPAENIDFDLPQAALIGGHLSDPDGTPISGARVSVFQDKGDGSFSSIADTWSENSGDYWLRLPAGSNYVVRAGGDYWWVDVLYSNVHHWEDALRLTAEVGAPLTGIDFTLAPGLTVSGQVRDDTNVGLDGVTVRLGAVDEAGNWTETGATVTEPGGYYQIMAWSGTGYVVRVDAPGYSALYFAQTLNPTLATPVSGVQGGFVWDIDFQLFRSDVDSDGDGVMDDIEAYATRTNPWDDQDHLECTEVVWADGKAWLTWRSVSGTVYTVERSASLLDTDGWACLTTPPITATNDITTYCDQPAPAASLYRINVTY